MCCFHKQKLGTETWGKSSVISSWAADSCRQKHSDSDRHRQRRTWRETPGLCPKIVWKTIEKIPFVVWFDGGVLWPVWPHVCFVAGIELDATSRVTLSDTYTLNCGNQYIESSSYQLLEHSGFEPFLLWVLFTNTLCRPLSVKALSCTGV